MNVFVVEELVSIDDGQFESLKYFVLAKSLSEVSLMFEDKEITSIIKVCPITEFPEQKYCVIPSSEFSEEVLKDGSISEALEITQESEKLLRDLKRKLVRKQDYECASLARDIQFKIRELLNIPVTLEELFRRQSEGNGDFGGMKRFMDNPPTE